MLFFSAAFSIFLAVFICASQEKGFFTTKTGDIAPRRASYESDVITPDPRMGDGVIRTVNGRLSHTSSFGFSILTEQVIASPLSRLSAQAPTLSDYSTFSREDMSVHSDREQPYQIRPAVEIAKAETLN